MKAAWGFPIRLDVVSQWSVEHGCNNYTTAMQSDPNQLIIMLLPSSTNQSVTPYHMHISREQSDSPHYPWLFWTNQMQDIDTNV